ncbi:gamma-glutamyltransferase 2 [Amycolatopsis sulphurea]|uniref:Gamma-glutamyltransferase 2 n=1 Tax=Amycolatopsis sulphurea TaxID=76022 RepID=A0A2A9G308_9PSEU|nr:gamma-glutamyltransferase [Amycolatopsis sulphurea]PFG57190.1 gamma-glutamyltransferase 2 [Amycolatopsis sulphurea]
MTSFSPLELARPLVTGSFGVSASTHWVASASAQSVLERGGNAFDAAVAAGFVLHIVEPHLNGPGGDLVAMVTRAGAEPLVLCGQGPTPASATIGHFRAEGLDEIPGSGALAAAVPGAVDAWLLLLRDYGTWELEDVLSYAIHYAERGHPLLANAAGVIASVATLFTGSWPTSAEQWLDRGRPPSPGEPVGNGAYGRTLRRLVEEARAAASGRSREARIDAARRAWGAGFVAEAVDRFVRGTRHLHSTGGDHFGVLTGQDMATFEAHLEPAVSIEFREHVVHKAGAWSQGPMLLQSLRILEGYGDDELDLVSERGIHLVAEALKLAAADREVYYGDDLTEPELQHLLSAEYGKTRRDLITETASVEFRPGRASALREPYRPPLRLPSGDLGESAGEPTVRVAGDMRGDTCHVDVIDRFGNAVSATPSGGWLQSSPTIPELGFCLGTRLQMMRLDPASPSALRPGCRPRTTLSPTTVVSDDGLIALGTPGGDQQDQWQLVFLLRVLAAGLGEQHAIELPMFHTTSFPGSFWPRTWEPGGLVVEDRLGAGVLAALEGRGHRLTRAGDWKLGRLSSARRDHRTGILSAAANPRGAQGYAVGR